MVALRPLVLLKMSGTILREVVRAPEVVRRTLEVVKRPLEVLLRPLLLVTPPDPLPLLRLGWRPLYRNMFQFGAGALINKFVGCTYDGAYNVRSIIGT